MCLLRATRGVRARLDPMWFLTALAVMTAQERSREHPRKASEPSGARGGLLGDSEEGHPSRVGLRAGPPAATVLSPEGEL